MAPSCCPGSEANNWTPVTHRLWSPSHRRRTNNKDLLYTRGGRQITRVYEALVRKAPVKTKYHVSQDSLQSNQVVGTFLAYLHQ